MQWLPYNVSELQVGSNDDLALLLLDVVDLQEHSGHPLPLLVDENIHYRVARMLYGKPYVHWAVGGLLREVPLLYGVWHAYKHTLTIVYRTYFAVLAHLDCTGQPPSRGPVTNKRRVLFMEKLFAALYLLRREMLRLVQERLRQHAPGTGTRTAEGVSSSADRPRGDGPPSDPEDAPSASGRVLQVAVRDLLDFYVPAMVRIGFLVRQCTWCGGPQGTVRGTTAREILHNCLLLQVHLQQDWEAQAEYTRTMAVALLMWQPWMSDLPGCAFVEESCEALLSRFAGACRRNKHLTGTDNAWRLYVTLPQSSSVSPGTRGSVRAELVRLIRDRVRALVELPDSRPFPQMRTATEGSWVAQPPEGFGLPGTPSPPLERFRWRQLLEGVAGVLSMAPEPSDNVSDVLDRYADLVHHDLLADRRQAHERMRAWALTRRSRVRSGGNLLRPPKPGGARGRGKGGRGDGTPSQPVVPPQDVPGGQEVVPAHDASQPSTYETESEGSLHSENYHSPGDTDGLGSVGALEEADASASETESGSGDGNA